MKFYNNGKGYGFITPDSGGNDVFVHVSALQCVGMDDHVEGQKVSFDVEMHQRSGKPRAVNIREG